jgi:putative acetyltransferase
MLDVRCVECTPRISTLHIVHLTSNIVHLTSNIVHFFMTDDIRLMTNDFRLILAESQAEFETAKSLFKEYAQWLNVDLCFQSFDQELADIAIQYGSPKGGIFLIKIGEDVAGCVGVRSLKNDTTGTICELKRMYVREAFRGKGYGKLLLGAALDLAGDLGYETMQLDTLPRLEAAIALYLANGFVEIGAYYHNPLPSVRYFEKKLVT